MEKTSTGNDGLVLERTILTDSRTIALADRFDLGKQWFLNRLFILGAAIQFSTSEGALFLFGGDIASDHAFKNLSRHHNSLY